MSTVATKIFTRFTGNIAELFRQLAAKGLIPEGDHDRSAELFADLLLGNRTVMIYFGWASAVPTDDDIAVKVELFINGGLRLMGAKPVPRQVKGPAAKKG
jgi:hypothetical protein